MRRFLICLCGEGRRGEPSSKHTVSCPRPEYRASESAVEQWLVEQRALMQQRAAASAERSAEQFARAITSLAVDLTRSVP